MRRSTEHCRRPDGPTVQPPTRRGFGTLVIEQIAGQLKGELLFD
jgi:hypothetical protein